MVGSFFIEKSNAKCFSRSIIWHRLARRTLRSIFESRQIEAIFQVLAARFYPTLIDFIPAKLTGFSPLKRTAGRQFRKACTTLAWAMLGPTGSQQQAQSLLSVSGLVLQLQKVDRYIQRGEHGQLIPATTLSSGLVGHRRHASAYVAYTCRCALCRKNFWWCNREIPTSRRCSRTNVEIARGSVEIQSQRNVVAFFQDEWSSSCMRVRGEGEEERDVCKGYSTVKKYTLLHIDDFTVTLERY